MWPRTRKNYPEPSANRPGETPSLLPLEVGFATDPGLSGKPNQDYYGIVETHYSIGENGQASLPILIAMIADGVSGARGSDIAGQLAVEIVRRVLLENEHVPIVARLEAAIARANQDIHLLVQNDPQLEGAGSTLIVTAVADDQLFIAHVGDSRAYLLRNRRLQMLTSDHRWGQEAVDAGELTPEAAAQHPDRNIVSRLLGTAAKVEVDHSLVDLSQGPFEPVEFFHWPRVDRMWLQAGDTLLLCSDGLSDVVPAHQIETTLNRTAPQQSATRLIELANAAGGPDNITAIVVHLPVVDSQRTNQDWYRLQPKDEQIVQALQPERSPLSLLRLLVWGWMLLMLALGLGVVLARWVLPSLQPVQLPSVIPSPGAVSSPNSTLAISVSAPVSPVLVITPNSTPIIVADARIIAQTEAAFVVTSTESALPQPSITNVAIPNATATANPSLPTPATLIDPPSATKDTSIVPTAVTAAEVANATMTPISPPLPSSPPLITSTPVQKTSQIIVPTAEQSLLIAEPIKAIVHSSSVTFRWRPNFVLQPGQAYELIIWPAGQKREKSARTWGGISGETVRILNFDELGISYGHYLWGVQLVQVNPYRVIEYLGSDYQIDYLP